MERIDWLNVGREYWEGNQDIVLAAIKMMTWEELPFSMGFSQGYAIKEIIKEFKIPKASHIADSHELAPYGLLGIRAHYTNADVDLFFVDDGIGATPICAHVTEIPACMCLTVTTQTVEERVAV